MLGGVVGGGLVAPKASWRLLALCAVAGALPDVDFLLPLQHRGPSHSIGAAVLVFGAALTVLSLRRPEGSLRLAAAVALAYASHTLLDWLGQDTWHPRGLMALWPFSSAYYISDLDVFNAVNRRYWMPGFWRTNGIAVLRELAILTPLVVLVLWRRRRRTTTSA